ncbi:type I pantothenate kinase, partial [Streptomyces anthocyanicus]
TRVGLAVYFDFSVYVDARAEDIERWYLNRFRKLRATAFQNPDSYFRKYTQVSEDEALDYARTTWRTINKPNLLENVAPTRGRATLVVRKGQDHKVQRLSLRKL